MKTLVIIPTYLEAENIADVLGKVRSVAPHAHVLVVDDASPDGTADLARAAGEELGQVDVLSRPGKGGLGGAYRAGFQRAFSEGYEVVVQMDADLSHPPDRLPALLAEVDKGADIAIGSRYVKGGATANWPLVRRLLSRTANIYASLMLGLGVRDATAGFRAYRAHRLGARIVEVPITFNDRIRGVSKMSWHIIGEAMSLVAWWALRDRILRRSGPIAKRPPRAEAGAPSPDGIAADVPTAVVSGGVPDNPAAREPDVEAAAK